MKKHKAVINISPLCDVCFTTLMTLMVTVPIIAVTGTFKVDLPAANTREMRDEGALNVSVKLEGDSLLMAVGDVDIREATLEKTFEAGLKLIKEEIAKNPDRMVLIRADRFVLHGIVLELLRFAKMNGAERIAVATSQRGRG